MKILCFFTIYFITSMRVFFFMFVNSHSHDRKNHKANATYYC